MNSSKDCRPTIRRSRKDIGVNLKEKFLRSAIKLRGYGAPGGIRTRTLSLISRSNSLHRCLYTHKEKYIEREKLIRGFFI